MANLSVPSETPTPCSVKSMLNAGSGIVAISAGVFQNSRKAFLDTGIMRTMDPLQSVRVAYDHLLQVMEMPCPVRIALHPHFGAVTLYPFALAVPFGMNDVLILECPMLEILGLDMYTG